MNIKELEKEFHRAIKIEDPILVLDILDILYNAKDYDRFEEWRKSVVPFLKDMQERDRQYAVIYPR